MANCMLGFPNRIDEAVLSGGSWTTGLPLTNLKSRVLGKVARTQSTSTASTRFDVDLIQSRKVGALSIVNHNLSLGARYRITGAESSSFAILVHDSGWRDVWPVVYPFESLAWEDDNWWSGKYTVEEVTGYTAACTHILPRQTLARYWRIELADPTNQAGYLQLGRLFIGPVWQPVINMITNGAAIGWETDTTVQKARSGAEYFDVRAPTRFQRFTLAHMEADEAFSRAFELQRRAGIDKEILFIHDPDDTVHALRRQFLSRIRQLSPIEYPYYNHNNTAFELKELR